MLENLNVLKGNINLANTMIDTTSQKELASEVEEHPLIDIIAALNKTEGRLYELTETMDNEEMLKVCIIVNEDLHKTFLRFQNLVKGKPSGVFQPGESFFNTVLTPSLVYETPEQKAIRLSSGSSKSEDKP